MHDLINKFLLRINVQKHTSKTMHFRILWLVLNDISLRYFWGVYAGFESLEYRFSWNYNIFQKFSISTREFIEISRCFSMNRDLFLDCRDWFETRSGLQIEISVEPRSRSRFGIGNPSADASMNWTPEGSQYFI